MFSTNLRRLRNEKKLSQEKLAAELNAKYDTRVSKSMISRWERGTTDPQMKYVRIVADYFGLSTDLVESNPAIKQSNQYAMQTGSKRLSIPIIGEIACGDPITAEENIDGYTEETFISNTPTGTLFALRCKGHSMEPTIPNGALAILHEQPVVEDGEIAAVLNADNEATLKRVKHQGDTVMLLPDNKDYDPIILDKNHPGRILGKVIRYSVDL